MHRAYTIILAILLVIAMAIPVFASETSDAFYQIPAEDWETRPYGFMYMNGSKLNIILSHEPFKIESTTLISFGYWHYEWTGTEWKTVQGYNSPTAESKLYYRQVTPIWTNVDIYDDNGQLYLAASSAPGECNGSTCPATDLDHNNICDDCGGVLTFSLRSSLLDYAKTFAESYASGYPYYAVVQHPTDSTAYNVYMSKTAMHADVPNYDVAVGSGMQYTRVYTKVDGSFDRDTFISVESFSGDVVYANHTIENFREPPLAVVIQGVTGEAMKTEVPNLHQTMKTILLCGVGCLGLLIGLRLFGKKLPIFLSN